MRNRLESITEEQEECQDELCDVIIVPNNKPRIICNTNNPRNCYSGAVIKDGNRNGSMKIVDDKKTKADEHGSENERTPFLESSSTLSILDEFVRFDLIRTGAPCCIRYKVSVQYDDDFMLGKSGVSLSNSETTRSCGCHNSCLLSLFPAIKSIRYFSSCVNETSEDKTNVELEEFDAHNKISSKPSQNDLKIPTKKFNNPAFTLEYPSLVACFRPHKRRTFTVKDSTSLKEIGWIQTNSDIQLPIEIKLRKGDNTDAQKLTGRKIRTTAFSIENETGVKLGTIEMFRGLRGDVSSYGVSIIDDNLGPEGKAVLIAVATSLDVEERESELKCTFIWTPIIVLVIILLFSILPWMHYYKNDL